MSGTQEMTADLKAVRTRAADWLLARQLAENWTDADEEAFDAWFEESLAHRLAYLRLEATWQRTRRLAALRPSHDDAASPSKNAKRNFSWKISIASIAAALIAVAAMSVYLLQPKTKTYVTAIGGRSTIALSDGSTIELNTDTVLHISDGRYLRSAALEKGEALFHIKHDAARPFTVTAADQRVTDLGTEFTIRRSANVMTVVLLEGRARVDSTRAWLHADTAMLAPGDVLSVHGSSLSVVKQSAVKLANEIAWRRGVLVFENETLADAARELNRYNARKVVIADGAVGRLRFDASIRTDGVDVFTRVAQRVFGLRVETRPHEVVISR